METTEGRVDAEDRKRRLSPTKQDILAMRLQGCKSRGAASGEISVRPPHENPLSYGQERIWFQCQITPNAALFHIPLLARFDGPLDVAALEASLNDVIARHEVLRSGFRSESGVPLQHITSRFDLTVSRVDLQRLEPDLQQAEVDQRAAAEARKPFDLSTPPLLRATLLELGATRHVLLLTVHHIVWDGWSSGLLIKEIRHLYEARIAGTPHRLPPMSLQYGDFAYWHRQLVESDAGLRQMDYWTGRLEGLPEVLALPVDRPRKASQAHRGSSYSWRLSQDVRLGLAALARDNDVTLFSALLATFNALLFHVSGQNDIAVGTTIAFRTRQELEALIGFFANALVLRTNLRDDPSFETVLARVHEAALEAQSNQDVPFEKLVEQLVPKRGLSHNPLFQVAFVLHNLPVEKLALRDLTIAVEEISTHSAAFDLVLHIFDEHPGLRARFEYDADLFDESTIVELASYFDIMARSVLSDPTRRISALSLLTRTQERAVVDMSNAKLDAFPSELLLHRLGERTANGHAIAVQAGERTLTYDELSSRSNQLAHHLANMGVGPDVPVGIFLEPSIDVVSAILGVLKADGAYVPIDPSYPPARVRHVLADCRAAVLVTTREAAVALPDISIPVVFLDADAVIIKSMPTNMREPRARPGNLAYLIYTSGSTGLAKGVMVTHRSAVASTYARRQYYGAPVNAFLLLSSLAFDSSVAGMFWTLFDGGRLVIPGEAMRRDPRALVRSIAEHSISHLLCLPSFYSAILELASQTNCSSLQCSIVAGEECERKTAARHFERLPEVSLFNEYGPTECTVWSTVHRVRPDDDAGRMSIGRPIPGAEIYAVRAHGSLLPMGAAGELWAGGEGLARGYFGRPDLTAERFVPNPFNGNGSRLYRTGDRGRFRSGGEIEFLGRIDCQIKLRGYRVEPREVEEVLLGHPSTKDAIVVGRADKAGVESLIAYVVPVAGAKECGDDFKRYLAERLPDFMAPARVVSLVELPRLPNGKIDRGALLDVFNEPMSGKGAEQRPMSVIELLLADIWREVLGVENVNGGDNFFDLGGNSLSAIQVIARTQQLFGGEIPVTSIFDGNTLEEFARRIELVVGQNAQVNEELDALLAEIEASPEACSMESPVHGRKEGRRHV